MSLSRDFLHLNQLDAFATFCSRHGWVRETPKGHYEVLRLTHPKVPKPIILYRHEGGAHATIGWDQEAAWNLARSFVREKRSSSAVAARRWNRGAK